MAAQSRARLQIRPRSARTTWSHLHTGTSRRTISRLADSAGVKEFSVRLDH